MKIQNLTCVDYNSTNDILNAIDSLKRVKI